MSFAKLRLFCLGLNVLTLIIFFSYSQQLPLLLVHVHTSTSFCIHNSLIFKASRTIQHAPVIKQGAI